MPEIDENDELFEERDEDNADIRRLRSRARAASKLERENSTMKGELEQLRRQTAFASAGLALSEKKQAALLAAHGDTDLTADALRATAVELGFAQPATAEVDADQQRRDTAAQAQAQVGAAQAGGTAPPALPDLPTQIITAEQAGDWTTAMALKAQQVARQANFGA